MSRHRIRAPSPTDPVLPLTRDKTAPPAAPLVFGRDDPPGGKPGGTDEENAAARDELLPRLWNPDMLKALGMRRNTR